MQGHVEAQGVHYQAVLVHSFFSYNVLVFLPGEPLAEPDKLLHLLVQIHRGKVLVQRVGQAVQSREKIGPSLHLQVNPLQGPMHLLLVEAASGRIYLNQVLHEAG
jgi:hypothetical protein